MQQQNKRAVMGFDPIENNLVPIKMLMPLFCQSLIANLQKIRFDRLGPRLYVLESQNLSERKNEH